MCSAADREGLAVAVHQTGEFNRLINKSSAHVPAMSIEQFATLSTAQNSRHLKEETTVL
jgi:hypothetical protein